MSTEELIELPLKAEMRLIQHHHRTAACEYGIAMHLRAREYLLGVKRAVSNFARRKSPLPSPAARRRSAAFAATAICHPPHTVPASIRRR